MLWTHRRRFDSAPPLRCVDVSGACDVLHIMVVGKGVEGVVLLRFLFFIFYFFFLISA